MFLELMFYTNDLKGPAIQKGIIPIKNIRLISPHIESGTLIKTRLNNFLRAVEDYEKIKKLLEKDCPILSLE